VEDLHSPAPRRPCLEGSRRSPSLLRRPWDGTASRTFADQGGKTPAQLWAEKKARERGTSGSAEGLPPSGYTGQSPIQAQTSGGGQWESGYSARSGPPCKQRTRVNLEAALRQQLTGEQAAEEDAPRLTGWWHRIYPRPFSGGAPPMGAPASFDRAPPPAPEPDTTTKPNRGISYSWPSHDPDPEECRSSLFCQPPTGPASTSDHLQRQNRGLPHPLKWQCQ